MHIISKKIIKQCEVLSDPSRIDYMAKYLRYQFEMYGIAAPKLNELVRSIWQTEKELIKENIKQIVKELWQSEHRELHYIAQNLLKKCQKDLSENDLPLLRFLITNNSWWDTVDSLSSNPLGAILYQKDGLQRRWVMEAFDAENMWLIRSAIIFQLKYKDHVNESLLFDTIDKCKDSKEFFIQKACGWALRQYSKYEPSPVKDFLMIHEASLSSLCKREASKYLNF